MGCAQSHIETEEPVSRCKARRHLMRDAVAARHAFAAAHSAYAVSLKNTGAALSDFGHGESIAVHPDHPPFSSSSSSSSSVAAVAVPLPPPIEAPPPPPPPPPPPADDGTPTSPIQRAASMPNISALKPSQAHHDSSPIPEDDPAPDAPVSPRGSESSTLYDSIFSNHNIPTSQSEIVEEKAKDPVSEKPSETPDKVVEEPLRSLKQGRKEKRVKIAGVASIATQKSANLVQILNELDDHFLKASESAHEVSKLLEVTRMHYHSNFAESQGEC